MSADPDFERLAPFLVIGGNAIRDITKEDYLKGWDGLQGHKPAVEGEKAQDEET